MRSSHRCANCRSYTELVWVQDGQELHACPVCSSAVILNVVKS